MLPSSKLEPERSTAQLEDFFGELEDLAKKQAKLHQERVLPKQLDWLTSLVGTYPWQTLVLVSGATAVLIELIKRGVLW